MKFLAPLSMLWCLSLGASVPFEQGDIDVLDKDNMFVPSWEMEVTPGGPTVILNGTIQEVHAQLVKLNPDYDSQFNWTDMSIPHENDLENESSLAKRTDFGDQKLICMGKWARAAASEVRTGIRYLRRVPGRPYADAGPSRCARVSCSWWASIYWCNDDNKPKTLESFASIGDGAGYIYDMCIIGFEAAVSGQVFHETRWNVIVRWDQC